MELERLRDSDVRIEFGLSLRILASSSQGWLGTTDPSGRLLFACQAQPLCDTQAQIEVRTASLVSSTANTGDH